MEVISGIGQEKIFSVSGALFENMERIFGMYGGDIKIPDLFLPIQMATKTFFGKLSIYSFTRFVVPTYTAFSQNLHSFTV